MTTSIVRRLSASALVIVATAAISLSGSTEAWGKTSTWEVSNQAKTSTWEVSNTSTTQLKTSTWE